MQRLRQVVFVLFATAYLVACPLVLLQAFGYSLRPGAEQRLVKTGLIYLETTPPGATVHVGRRRFTRTTPSILRGLFPASYDVRISLPGYQAWTRTIQVEAEKSAAFEHILLTPTSWTRVWTLPGPFQELVPLPDTRWLLVRRGATLAEHLFVERKTGHATPLVPANSPVAEAKILSLWSVPGSPAIVVRLGVPADGVLLWIEPNAEGPRVDDLTGLVPPGAQQLAWDPLDRRAVYVLEDGVLSRVHLPSKSTSVLARGIHGFDLFERSLYLLDQAQRLLQADLDGKGVRLLKSFSPASWEVLSGRPPADLRAFGKDAILLLGSRGELVMPGAALPLVERGVLGLAWEPRRRRTAVWQRDRIGLLDPSVADDADPRVRWIFEGGERITQAFWAHQGSHLVLHDGDQLSLLELDRTSPPAMRTLFPIRPGSPVAYDDDTGLLFYLEPSGDALCATALIPRRDLLGGFTLPDRQESSVTAP